MTYRTSVARDLFSELDRLHRDWLSAYAVSTPPGAQPFPALNISRSADAIEIYAFAPGLRAEQLDAKIEAGRLTIAGERPPGETGNACQRERFTGRFRRVVELPTDADPTRVSATYRDGVLRIRVPRSTAMLPRRIAIN